jgi:hypothetical protein
VLREQRPERSGAANQILVDVETKAEGAHRRDLDQAIRILSIV